jgi:ribosomal protein S27AE
MRPTYYVVFFRYGRVYTQGTLYQTAEEHAKDIAAENDLGEFQSLRSLGNSMPKGWVEGQVVMLYQPKKCPKCGGRFLPSFVTNPIEFYGYSCADCGYGV